MLLNIYSLVKYQVVTFSASVDFPTVSICCKIPYIPQPNCLPSLKPPLNGDFPSILGIPLSVTETNIAHPPPGKTQGLSGMKWAVQMHYLHRKMLVCWDLAHFPAALMQVTSCILP